MKTIVIGGVGSGGSCAARLRRLDEHGEIILLERGQYISYANCGLPYYVGGEIKQRESLLVVTPEKMIGQFNVDVRVLNEVIEIDREKKLVKVKKVETGEVYEESYDKLVIATGASPFVPNIPGKDSARITKLWTVPDADHLHTLARQNKSAVVVGGGFIGIEMAENLNRLGLKVSLVEGTDQVMAPMDYEMAQLLHQNIRDNGVDLILSDTVESFNDNGDNVTVNLKSGKSIIAELIVLSIGTKPNSKIASDAGIKCSDRGFIEVNDNMLTNDEDIYAVGDVIMVTDFQFGNSIPSMLAGPANKHGRIAADNLGGMKSAYRGMQATSVAKVFDMQAGATGSNEKKLNSLGLKKGIDYETLIITQNNHAGYYPGAVPMVIKMIFAKDGSKIYGSQIVGMDGVDKRTDVIATAIRLGATVQDIKELELGYGPAFSSAKDPVNMAGFVAGNVIDGLVKFADCKLPDEKDCLLLDIRTDVERMAYELPNAVKIPLEELRDRLNEIDKGKKIVIFCTIGVRSYTASRMLRQNGFDNVFAYPGGVRVYRATHMELEEVTPVSETANNNIANENNISDLSKDKIELDCCGLQCPGPIMKVYETVKGMEDGELLEVTASDPGFNADIEAWCRRTGNTLVDKSRGDKKFTAVVKKGSGDAVATAGKSDIVTHDTADGKTIIVFSGDFDKVMASFIIANGAAAMGRKVTMFFTFWGLTALRRPDKQNVKKNFMESMFGAMLPRGVDKLGLSKMNMAGMGTAMMKKIMNDKNVNTLEDLIKKALENGVHIMACTMSMDVMGIKEEELIDGVELAGVGTYLGNAEESNVNLFI